MAKEQQPSGPSSREQIAQGLLHFLNKEEYAPPQKKEEKPKSKREQKRTGQKVPSGDDTKKRQQTKKAKELAARRAYEQAMKKPRSEEFGGKR